MNSAIKITLVGAMLVLLFDAVWAGLSVWTGIIYSWFSIGSFILYLIFSFLAARRSKWFYGAAVGAFLGLVDSTLGWAISWTIGPGKPTMEMNLVLIVGTIFFVVIFAAVLGLVGGAFSLLKQPSA